jgi:hypothetical protein
MRRRHLRRHRPERQPRPSLEAVVRDCGCPADELAYYVAFARELVRAERAQQRKQQAQAQAPGTGPVLQTGNWKLGAARMRPRPFPDYSRRTKSIVAKWFRRGLSGHLMWLIGKAVLGKLE